MPKRRPSPGPATAIAGVLLLATAACSADPEVGEPSTGSTGSTGATAEPTPLADYDTSAVTVVRAAFCDRVSDGAIAAAVADDASEGQSWQPGKRLPDSSAIGNEFGCAWTAGPVTARAWVFAPPVTPARAKDLLDEVVGKKCQGLQTAELGEPSISQRCDGTAGLTGIYGLVGDAWLSCEISGRDDVDVDLVGEWCVAVLEALRSE